MHAISSDCLHIYRPRPIKMVYLDVLKYYLAWIISIFIQWNYELQKYENPYSHMKLTHFGYSSATICRRHSMYTDLIAMVVTITAIIVFRRTMKLYCCATSRQTLEFALRGVGMLELHWPPHWTNVRALRTEMAESRRRIKRTGYSVHQKREIVKAF